jgi:hypothetical protein
MVLDLRSFLVGLAGSLVISAFFFALDRNLRRAKVIGSGEGSGGGGGISISNLIFSNQPSFFGFKTARDAAQLTGAWLFEPESGEHLAPMLLWQLPNGDLTEQITIPAGEQRTLCLFVKGNDRDDTFIYTRGCRGAAPLPQGLTKLPTGIRDYEIHINDQIGRQYRFRILKDRDAPRVHFKTTVAERRQRIVEGMKMIGSAFRRR